MLYSARLRLVFGVLGAFCKPFKLQCSLFYLALKSDNCAVGVLRALKTGACSLYLLLKLEKLTAVSFFVAKRGAKLVKALDGLLCIRLLVA